MIRKTMTVLALGLAMTAAGANLAMAQSAAAKAAVDSGKASGTVGEQADGYLGIVSGGDAALRAAVAEINAGRAAVYREAAAKSGATPEAAGASAFTTVISGRIKAGEYYKTAAGAWVRK